MLRSANVLVPALVLLLAGAASAQHAGQPLPPAWLRQVPAGTDARARAEVVYDVHAGRITSVTPLDPDVHAVNNDVCFDNSEAVGPWVVSDPGIELVDWGIKNCRKVNRVSRIRMLYVTSALDTAQGGPGAALHVAFYTGTRGFGRLGTEVFRGSFTGLPGADPQFGLASYELVLDFGLEPLEFSDGMLGWGLMQLDGRTGIALVNAPSAATQTADALDTYSPGPARHDTYVGTFNYGAICTCASLWIKIEEIEASEVAHTTVQNGSGVNPVTLLELQPPRVGGTFAAFVNTGTTASTLLFSSSSALAPRATPFGEVLINPATRLAAPIAGLGSYAVAIPGDLALIGQVVYLQAGVLPPSVPQLSLTNALRLRLGY